MIVAAAEGDAVVPGTSSDVGSAAAGHPGGPPTDEWWRLTEATLRGVLHEHVVGGIPGYCPRCGYATTTAYPHCHVAARILEVLTRRDSEWIGGPAPVGSASPSP